MIVFIQLRFDGRCRDQINVAHLALPHYGAWCCEAGLGWQAPDGKALETNTKGGAATPFAKCRPPRYRANMTDTPPDRLSIDPSNPHYNSEVLERGIGIRFKGNERRDVEEYCMSEGWIRVQAGKTMDRRGKPLTLKLSGPVEAYFENAAKSADDAQPEG